MARTQEKKTQVTIKCSFPWKICILITLPTPQSLTLLLSRYNVNIHLYFIIVWACILLELWAELQFLLKWYPWESKNVLFSLTVHLTRTFRVQMWTDRHFNIYSEPKHRTEQQQLVIWIELTRNGSSCQKLLEDRKQNHLQPSMK